MLGTYLIPFCSCFHLFLQLSITIFWWLKIIKLNVVFILLYSRGRVIWCICECKKWKLFLVAKYNLIKKLYQVWKQRKMCSVFIQFNIIIWLSSNITENTTDTFWFHDLPDEPIFWYISFKGPSNDYFSCTHRSDDPSSLHLRERGVWGS